MVLMLSRRAGARTLSLVESCQRLDTRVMLLVSRSALAHALQDACAGYIKRDPIFIMNLSPRILGRVYLI